MRKLIMKSDKNLNEDEQWQKIVPYDTRQLAIKECITCYKSNETKLSKKTISKYYVNYKTKKSTSQTFSVNKNALKNSKLFISRFKNQKKASILRTRKRTKKLLSRGSDGDFVIQLHNTNWYVCLLTKQKDKDKPVINNQSYQSVFLDPGIRKFQSFYSPDGYCGYIDDTYNENCEFILNKLDTLQSFKDKPQWKVNKHNIIKRMKKLRTKISNLINDLQWKLSNYLCKHFKTILIPVFQTQKMIMKSNNRKINTKTARMFNVFKHYQFRQRLHHVARKYNSQIVVVTEPYTSKTCGKCGSVNNALNGSETFHCQQCNLIIDRDFNGARNNGLAYLTIHKATI